MKRITGLHLDSRNSSHHDASVRTTVTLEKDVEQMLRDAMHRSRKSFKRTLNDALRAGLSGKTDQAKRKRFIVHARPLGLRAGFDPAGYNRLVDDLEIDGFLEKQTPFRRS